MPMLRCPRAIGSVARRVAGATIVHPDLQTPKALPTGDGDADARTGERAVALTKREGPDTVLLTTRIAEVRAVLVRS